MDPIIYNEKYLVTPDDNMPSIYMIKYRGKGSVHKDLRGRFTSPKYAFKEIERYESNTKRKAPKGKKGDVPDKDDGA